MPMPVADLIRAMTCRSGSGSSFASAMRPRSVDRASNSGGLVSASAAAISVVGSSAEATTGRGRLRLDRIRGLRLHCSVRVARVILGAGATLQIVVEVVAVERRDDLVRDVGPVQTVRERRGRLAAGVSGIGVDGDAPGTLGPLEPRQTVGRQCRPDRRAEERVGGERRLDPLGDADLTILRHREQPDHGILHAAEHLLARRRLGAAVVEQEGAVDARCALPVRQPQDRDEAGPATAAVEVRKIGMEQQVGRSGIRDPAGVKVGLARRARDRAGHRRPDARISAEWSGRARMGDAGVVRGAGWSIPASRAASSKSAPSQRPVACAIRSMGPARSPVA